MENTEQKAQQMKQMKGQVVSRKRRKLLQWSVPALTVVSLPAHAQCSEGLDENAMPVVSADVKCTLNTNTGVFEGESTIEIRSDGGAISINNIMVTGLGPNDSINLPSFPAVVTSDSSIQITWQGESADGVTCLPVNDFDIDIFYGCTNVADNQLTINILDLLA